MSYPWRRFLKKTMNYWRPTQAIHWLLQHSFRDHNKPNAPTTNTLSLSLSQNTLGRDFVVGDIHGCYTALSHALEMLFFNPDVDRLICVGDLLNRGMENMQSLIYLRQPWFYSVMGNHDWAHAFEHHNDFSHARIRAQHLKWAKEIRHREDYQSLSQELQKLPLLIDVETAHGLVGIVHGEIPPEFDSWQSAKHSLSACTQCIQDCRKHPFIRGRSRQQKNNKVAATQPVSGVSMVISGHTPQKSPTWIGNSLFIDTGLVHSMHAKKATKGGLSI